ncbi:hypothetical protein HDU93_003890, partial [Gonapodya sp. JEL0774]
MLNGGSSASAGSVPTQPAETVLSAPAVRFRTPSDTTLADPQQRWSDATINNAPDIPLATPVPPPILVNRALSFSGQSSSSAQDNATILRGNHVIACLPDAAAVMGAMDPYVHGALAYAVEALVQ